MPGTTARYGALVSTRVGAAGSGASSVTSFRANASDPAMSTSPACVAAAGQVVGRYQPCSSPTL